MAVLLAVGQVGCSSGPDLDPVSWWHDLEGGKIADDRPPPPNADQPYRALGDAPQDKPVPTNPATRGQIAEALVADRANAQYAAALDPLAPVAPAPAANVPAAPAAPAGGADASNASNASLAAASAPPPAKPAPAPTSPVQSADLAALPAQTAGNAAAPAVPPAEMPTVPDAPPPPAALPGVLATTAPTPPAVPPPPKPVPPAPLVVGAPVTVPFATGSASLPSWAVPGLKSLALSRKTGTIAITGFGDAHDSDPAAQAGAMPLALARARSVAANLLEAGVPSDALRISAEAQGAGAVARLIN